MSRRPSLKNRIDFLGFRKHFEVSGSSRLGGSTKCAFKDHKGVHCRLHNSFYFSFSLRQLKERILIMCYASQRFTGASGVRRRHNGLACTCAKRH